MSEEKDIENLVENIKDAADFLVLASCSLRSCYCEQDSSCGSFIELRSQVTNSAKVYQKKILPFSNAVIRHIEEFCDNYLELSYEEFVEDLPNLIEEANNNVDICKFTLELHKAVCVDFKTSKDLATNTINEMKLGAKYWEEKGQKLKESSETSIGWAVILFFIPGVSMIATPLLIARGVKKDEMAVAMAEEASLAYKAANAVELSLVPLIDKFIEAMKIICGFFEVLSNQLTTLAGYHQKFQDDAKEKHYKFIKARASKIVKACHYYMSQIPDCETNFRAIPDNHDKNYVQEWLLKKCVNTDSDNEEPLILWGIRLLASDKKLINLITY